MLCANCGNQITAGGRFCTRCGTAHPSVTPASVGSRGSLIGRTIDDKYRLDGKLGAGGMGTVYRAARLFIGDTVAIKILHSEHVNDRPSFERFRREAQAAARLKHPNAVAIYDFGVSNEGLVYLVMELAEGQSLRSIIKQQGPLTPSAAVEVISQVCQALDEAHRQNIVHRDLKPDNIMVNAMTSSLRVKVLDFGIAKLRDLSATASTLTQSGAIMGTPHYMSPEQCLGEELDGRSDIYSLGIVLYEMLTGMVPFNSPTPTAVVVQQVTQAPPPPRAINVSISPAIEAVVLRALEKRRDARPQTAAAFAHELAAAASNMAVAPPSPYWTGATKVSPTDTYASPVTTPMLAPTVKMDTPGVGEVTPAGLSLPPSKAAHTVKPGSKFLALIVSAALAMALIAGAVIWLAHKKSEEDQAQANKNQAQATNSQTGKPSDDALNKQVTNPPSTGTSDPVSLTPPASMVFVPGGEFLMGSDTGDESERPPHRVTVKPFFVDRYEVTCDEYESFVRATGHAPPPGWVNGRHPQGRARCPVTGVDWDDANAYTQWAGKRLPSEEEWEFAARGTTGRRYPWGNEWRAGMANADTSAHGHAGVADVGEHKGASPFGVFDMVGNAWEWTASNFAAYPGGQSVSPQNGQKVIRGGSWKSNRNQATATSRMGLPAHGGSDYSDTGFRCAKNAESFSGSQ